jgi:hypothetical protein
MRSHIAAKFVMMGMMLGLGACNTDGPVSSGSGGRVKVYLTDAPADNIEKFTLTISSVEAKSDKQWVVISTGPMVINLLDYHGGKSVMLAEAFLLPGSYSDIRLNVSSAVIVVNGQSIALDLDDVKTSGLHLKHHFDIQVGATVDLVIDMHAKESCEDHGQGKWKLKPKLRIVSLPLAGSISGVIDPPHAGVLVKVFEFEHKQELELVTSTTADPLTGRFTLAFLPPGKYWVQILDPGKQQYTVDNVEVKSGVQTDVGVIVM